MVEDINEIKAIAIQEMVLFILLRADSQSVSLFKAYSRRDETMAVSSWRAGRTGAMQL